MTTLPERHSDVLIIGNGCAGLACAAMLARSGKAVSVLSRGTPATAMSSGCLTGFSDIGPILKFNDDAHKVGIARDEAKALFLAMALKGGLRYVRPDGPLIDAHGLAHQADLAPIWTLTRSDVVRAEHISIMCAPGECNLLGTYLARTFPEKKVSQVAAPHGFSARGVSHEDLEAAVRSAQGELVIIPPVLRSQGFDDRMSMLEIGMGKRVRETYAPLGLPGIRMRQALEQAALSFGASVQAGMDVVGIDIDGRSFDRLHVLSGMRDLAWSAKALVHCGGGIIGGGLDVARTDAVDHLSLFNIANVPVPSGAHSIMGQGLKVDAGQHVCHKGLPLENIFAAGSALPGISYPLGAGMGTVMTSAVLAAKGVLDGW